MMEITSVPRTPEHVKGVINLRGKVIPVISLRRKFAIREEDFTDRTCIIVVEILGTAGAIPIGIIVDSVSEVLNISGEDIEPTPVMGSALDTQYILGMAKVKGKVKILLDIGEERTIVAGLAGLYSEPDLVGKQVVVVANLEPVKLMGVESNGMVLAAEDKAGVHLLTTDAETAPGSKIR